MRGGQREQAKGLLTCQGSAPVGEREEKGRRERKKTEGEIRCAAPEKFPELTYGLHQSLHPETHAQLSQGWEHTGIQAQMPADHTTPPSAPLNKPGCPGQTRPRPPHCPASGCHGSSGQGPAAAGPTAAGWAGAGASSP